MAEARRAHAELLHALKELLIALIGITRLVTFMEVRPCLSTAFSMRQPTAHWLLDTPLNEVEAKVGCTLAAAACHAHLRCAFQTQPLPCHARRTLTARCGQHGTRMHAAHQVGMLL